MNPTVEMMQVVKSHTPTKSTPTAMSMMNSPQCSPFKSPTSSCFTSPASKKFHYNDRLMPVRDTVRAALKFNMEPVSPSNINNENSTSNDTFTSLYARLGESSEYSRSMLHMGLIANELLDADIENVQDLAHCIHPINMKSSPLVNTQQQNVSDRSPNMRVPSNGVPTTSFEQNYHSQNSFARPFDRDTTPVKRKQPIFTFKRQLSVPSRQSLHSLSPLSLKSQKLLQYPKQTLRQISKIPYKVLDAPDLQDDFYLNLIDWSSRNLLAVGLGACVYLWNAANASVTKLCDLGESGVNTVTSVCWDDRGKLLAVGTHQGLINIYDCDQIASTSNGASSPLTRLADGHSSRVGALAWNGDLLCSGSRDKRIIVRHVHQPATGGATTHCRRLEHHRQEVCGLRWSPDRQYLASGGNDNCLLVWSATGGGVASRIGRRTGSGGEEPMHAFTQHHAAVKAIAWSPHQHGLLASGGGTADKCIRFWNSLTGQPLQHVDTGSQVCNLAWSSHSNELVSTHGYSENQIVVWKYGASSKPGLTQLAKLVGHTYRVLYLATSPCGESIVTGAGDETLRFWNVFSRQPNASPPVRSLLDLDGHIR